MCGITGIFDLTGKRPVDEDRLTRMRDTMVHRGPDGAGNYIAPGIGLAHRRLAIIDLEGGKQPFLASSGQYVLTFNGEIYNYPKLASALENINIPLKTRSDTEVIAEGLAHHGVDYVNKLRGMFAFAFWDARKEKLTLARDRLGEKPLYYTLTDDGWFLFASEIQAILAAQMIHTTLNQEAVADYMQFGYVPDPKTIYKNIHKLLPGHILYLQKGREPRLEQYWDLDFSHQPNLDFDTICENLVEHLDQAVSSQMISDVPLGAFLSGGVDSSAIVSSMSKNNRQAVTCSIGFDEASHDEREFARQIAAQYQTLHHEEQAGLDVTGSIDTIANVYGEPFADSSALPTWLVSKLARKHVTVALSGDGGDELFAGYRRHLFFLREEKLRTHLPSFIRKPLFGPLGKYYPKLDFAPRPLRFKTTFQALGEDQADAYARAASIILPERAQSLLSTDFQLSLQGYSPNIGIRYHMENSHSTDPLSRALYTDAKTWLSGRMLVKTDRASMAHSLEVRPPLLDHKLVEWAASLPSNLKLSQGKGKFILKRAMEKRLPKQLLYRPKQGFGLPVSQWLRVEDDNPLDRLYQSSHWRDCGILSTKTIDTMIKAHLADKADYGQELWSVLMFDAFLAQQKNHASQAKIHS